VAAEQSERLKLGVSILARLGFEHDHLASRQIEAGRPFRLRLNPARKPTILLSGDPDEISARFAVGREAGTEVAPNLSLPRWLPGPLKGGGVVSFGGYPVSMSDARIRSAVDKAYEVCLESGGSPRVVAAFIFSLRENPNWTHEEVQLVIDGLRTRLASHRTLNREHNQ
jgi:hypothetical protein